MSACLIHPIILEPYSSEQLIVICGYNCEEVINWFKNEDWKPADNNLKSIRKHCQIREEWLSFFKDHKEDIDGLDKDGEGIGKGMYIYRELKNNKGCKVRAMVLKYGWSPYDPENMKTLAHEMLHVCQEFLPQFLNRDEEMEAEAYFHSYLMQNVYKEFL
jgi:hypothetical protein